MKRYNVVINLNCIAGELTGENMTNKATILFTQSVLDRYNKYGGLIMHMKESDNINIYNETKYNKEVEIIDNAEKILYSSINKNLRSIDDIFPVYIHEDLYNTWRIMLSTINNDFYLLEYSDEFGYKRV